MADNVLDTVAFALDADLGPYSARLAQAEAETAAAAKRIGTTFGQGISRNLSEMQRAGIALNDLFKDGLNLNKLSDGLRSLRKPLEDVEDGMRKSGHAAHGALRYYREIFDELSSGRTKYLPSTVATLATQFYGVSFATLAWGAAIAGIPAALGVAAYSAETAISRVNRALAATGFAGGLSPEAAYAMAANLSQTTDLSQRGALDAIGALSRRGNISAPLIGRAASVVPGFASATGLSADKAAAELEKILSDPAKGAAELNDQFKLLSVAQTRQIEDLEKAGDDDKAQSIIVTALHQRFATLEDSTWSLSKVFDSFGKGLSNFWFRTGTVVAGTPDLQAKELELARLHAGPMNTMAERDRAKQLGEEISKLLAKSISDGLKAQAGSIRSALNDSISKGMADVDKDNKFASKMRDLQDQLTRDNSALDAAKKTHSQFTDQIQKERDAVALALKNQYTPAQEASMQAAEDRRIASASPANRAFVEAQVRAERARRQALSSPSTALYAGSIYSSTLSTAGVEQAARSQQTIVLTQQEAQAELALAKAYEQGGQAVTRQQAANEAHMAWLKGEITNEKAYAAALRDRAFAEQEASAAQKVAEQALANAALGRIAGSDGSPAAMAAARRHNEAVAATQGLFNSASTPAQIAAAQQKLSLLEQEYTLRDRINQQIQANDEDRKLAQTLEEKRLELSLTGQDEAFRAKELADLQTKNQLIEEGYIVGSKAFQDELEKRSQINAQIQQTEALIKRANAENEKWQTISRTVVGDIGNLFDAAMQPGTKLHQIYQMLATDVAKLIEQLLILGPLQNTLTKAFTGTPGTQPSASLGDLWNGISSLFGFGGGGSDISSVAVTPSVFGTFAKGGAWSAGVRYAASGMVLPGATMFHTSSGPVVGGELGPNSEALMPLARGPDGRLGVASHGAKRGGDVNITQVISVHPDVSAIARGEVMKQMPKIQEAAISGVRAASRRGVNF